MSAAKFFFWLTGISVTLIGVLQVLKSSKWYDQISMISFFSITFFVALSIAIYFLARATSTSQNKNSLTQLIMILVFVKILACLIIIITYDRIYQPASNVYVLPFFVIYLVYTILEVYVLTLASRMLL